MLSRISKEVQDRVTRELLIYLNLREVPNGLIYNILYVIDHPRFFNEEAKEILDELKVMYDSSRNGKPPLNSVVNGTASKLRDLNQYLIDPQYKTPDLSAEGFYKFLSTEFSASELDIRSIRFIINMPELYGDEI